MGSGCTTASVYFKMRILDTTGTVSLKTTVLLAVLQIKALK